MPLLPSIPYPDEEKEKLAKLEELFREWHDHFEQNGAALVKHAADEMVFDGFLPYYFRQKKRILFIGWESVGITDLNYIKEFYDACRKRVVSNNFQRRMIKVAFGILNGMQTWDSVPQASEIGGSIGGEAGLSFAFMNISKLSNESDKSDADWPVISTAYALSTQGRNFVQEEIAILEPDVIVTMSLMGRFEDDLESLGKWERIESSHPAVSVWWLEIGSRRSLVIDTFHFAARNKEDNADYYVPICDAIRCGELKS